MTARVEPGCFWVDVGHDHRIGYMSELNLIRIVRVSTGEIVRSEVVEPHYPAWKFQSEIIYLRTVLSLN